LGFDGLANPTINAILKPGKLPDRKQIGSKPEVNRKHHSHSVTFAKQFKINHQTAKHTIITLPVEDDAEDKKAQFLRDQLLSY
jgi:hypothetical protein